MNENKEKQPRLKAYLNEILSILDIFYGSRGQAHFYKKGKAGVLSKQDFHRWRKNEKELLFEHCIQIGLIIKKMFSNITNNVNPEKFKIFTNIMKAGNENPENYLQFYHSYSNVMNEISHIFILDTLDLFQTKKEGYKSASDEILNLIDNNLISDIAKEIGKK